MRSRSGRCCWWLSVASGDRITLDDLVKSGFPIDKVGGPKSNRAKACAAAYVACRLLDGSTMRQIGAEIGRGRQGCAGWRDFALNRMFDKSKDESVFDQGFWENNAFAPLYVDGLVQEARSALKTVSQRPEREARKYLIEEQSSRVIGVESGAAFRWNRRRFRFETSTNPHSADWTACDGPSEPCLPVGLGGRWRDGA